MPDEIIFKKLEQMNELIGDRNILVHEYDVEEDCKQFYESAKQILPAYREYVKAIHQCLRRA